MSWKSKRIGLIINKQISHLKNWLTADHVNSGHGDITIVGKTTVHQSLLATSHNITRTEAKVETSTDCWWHPVRVELRKDVSDCSHQGTVFQSGNLKKKTKNLSVTLGLQFYLCVVTARWLVIYQLSHETRSLLTLACFRRYFFHACVVVPLQEILPLAPPTAVMALISLEDLEGLDDEQLDNDITDNPEPIDGDDHLLSHWQAVASTHQVSVPAGEGAGPLFSIIHHKQQSITSHILSHPYCPM